MDFESIKKHMKYYNQSLDLLKTGTLNYKSTFWLGVKIDHLLSMENEINNKYNYDAKLTSEKMLRTYSSLSIEKAKAILKKIQSDTATNYERFYFSYYIYFFRKNNMNYTYNRKEQSIENFEKIVSNTINSIDATDNTIKKYLPLFKECKRDRKKEVGFDRYFSNNYPLLTSINNIRKIDYSEPVDTNGRSFKNVYDDVTKLSYDDAYLKPRTIVSTLKNYVNKYGINNIKLNEYKDEEGEMNMLLLFHECLYLNLRNEYKNYKANSGLKKAFSKKIKLPYLKAIEELRRYKLDYSLSQDLDGEGNNIHDEFYFNNSHIFEDSHKKIYRREKEELKLSDNSKQFLKDSNISKIRQEAKDAERDRLLEKRSEDDYEYMQQVMRDMAEFRDYSKTVDDFVEFESVWNGKKYDECVTFKNGIKFTFGFLGYKTEGVNKKEVLQMAVKYYQTLVNCSDCVDCYNSKKLWKCLNVQNSNNCRDLKNSTDCSQCYDSNNLTKCKDVKKSENCTNCQNSSKLKECTDVYNSYDSHNCHNSHNITNCSNIKNSNNCTDCHDSDNLAKCTKVRKSRNCTDCHNSYELIDCVDCNECSSCKNCEHLYNERNGYDDKYSVDR